MLPSPTPSLSGSVAGTFRGAGWTPRIALSLLTIVLLVEAVSLAYHTAATALPAITAHFGTTQGGWVLTAYALSAAATAPIFGKLADRYGKRRMLLTVLAISVSGSVVAATSQSFEMLLVGRALEGCLAVSMFLTYSLIRDIYPPKIVPFAASISVTGAGALAIGIPTLLGVCIDNFGFRSVFVLSAIWVSTMAVLVAITTRESDVRSDSRIDAVGAFLIAAGIGSTLTGISLGNTWGWTDVRTLGLLVGGLAIMAVYVVTSLNRSEPILDIRMFTRRGMVIAAVVALVGFGISPVMQVLAALIGLTPNTMGGGFGLGMSATALAQITTPQTVTAVIAGLIVGLIVRKVGPWNTARIGMLMLGVSAAYLAFRHDSVPDMIIGYVIFGVGSGFTNGSLPNLVMAAAPVKAQATMSAGVQVLTSVSGAVMPILAFVILGRSEFTGPGGDIAYTDGGITGTLIACVVVSLLGASMLSTILRPRVGSFAPDDGTDAVQSSLLEAEMSSVTNHDDLVVDEFTSADREEGARGDKGFVRSKVEHGPQGLG
ncbi:MAG: MFS transporter [Rhodococcus sp. (in: high G+C Gram-positive bacteria)]|nr:MAG: MFS transporter [Rhodococcus sp. (in: high G+C Gram-positive bacteria)]